VCRRIGIWCCVRQGVECSTIHDQAENLGADIHRHQSSPLVPVREITTFWNGHTLTLVPLFIVCIAKEEIIDMVVNMLQIGGGHSFECLWWNSGEPWCFCIFEFCHGLVEFCPGDRVIKFPKGSLLDDAFKYAGVRRAVGVEDFVEVGG
jgi:hypothetical protein